MKRSYKTFSFLFALMFVLGSFTGCSPKKDTADIPFTEFTWTSTLDEVLNAEGEPDNSYDSTYGGMTYVFENKEYNGLNGSIKYLFDGDEKLVSMAWMYIPEDNEDRDSVYEDLYKQTKKWYGKTGFEANQGTAMGAVWYLESGNVMIAVMSTGINEAIQYQYFSPEVSSDGPVSQQK